ncbi:OmpA family protein [Compostibacter hankyongensis]|uniref:OmpA-like domain-containing protein n=1 Tax=Compostibacter hankyongensis TaxID=1007089 RepID=A0ABP8FY09_9BACT
MRQLTALIMMLLLIPLASEAQLLKKISRRAKERVNDRILQKTDEIVDKGFDKAEQAGKHTASKNTGTSTAGSDKTDQPVPAGSYFPDTASAPDGNFSVYSKFDFIPGERLLFYDDFSVDHKGDFPAQWNTNGSGEVVVLSGTEGRWLAIPDHTISFPEINGKLPENFTVEFDLFYPAGLRRPPVTFGFSANPDPSKGGVAYKKLFYFLIHHAENKVIYGTNVYGGQGISKEYTANAMAGKIIRVSIAVNGKRIRLYLDDKKLFDLPRAFDDVALRNNFHFRAGELIPAPETPFFVGNLRIAAGESDLRSKLIKEGRWTTTGILFAVNAAGVRPESYAVLKQIASVLREHKDLHIKITGHTDSDGEEAHNLTLSRNRALAVKNILVNTFGIRASRLSTDGRGESDPVADNSTAEGKAKNRRVEFRKEPDHLPEASR